MSEQPVGSPLSMHDPPSVGPWVLESRLGAGGMGVVFYGRSADWGSAAVKVIRPGLLDAPATRDRFRREVALLRSVRDIHICEFLDADLESEPAWLAIEYISGPVLRDEILENGALPEEQWWDLARGLAQALAVLEVHRITHRDLKPGNVILHDRGPVLIDFGIAIPEDATALTATGLVTGSPAWLSPEQANLEPTGPASDIFSLGSLLAFAATGRPPFGEGASVAVLVSITSREPDLAGLDPARTALLRRMLAKSPKARPTARQVLDLTRASGTDPGTRRPTPTPRRESPAGTTTPEALPAVGGPVVGAPVVAEPPAAPPVAGARPVPGGPDAPLGFPPVRGFPPVPSTPPANPASSGTGSTRVGGAPSSRPAAPAPASAGRGKAARRPVPATAPPTAAPSAGRPFARWIAIAAVVAVVALGLWWGLGFVTDGEYGGTPGGSSDQPPSSRNAPDAPSSDVLRSGDWLLSSYRLINNGAELDVAGTVVNRGTATASANLTVWVYLADGTSLGSVGTAVRDVPADGSVSVTMTGDAEWAPGAKVVLLEAK